MKRRSLLVCLVSFALLTGGVLPSFAGPEKVSPLLRKFTDSRLPIAFDVRTHQQAAGVLDAAASGEVRCLIQGELTRAQLEVLGVRVATQAGPVFTAWVPVDRIAEISELPGLVRIEAARKVRRNLDVALAETQIEPKVHGASAPPYPGTGNTGLGVLIGDVDSGFDYTHADFRTSGGLSRFQSIWDQQVATVNPPVAFGYGREWDKASLDAQTATTDDPDGHGTHVMGIAGGNGRGTGNSVPQYTYVGVAPEATLVGVKTDYTDAGIIDGVDYIFQTAAGLGMNAVANLSLGGQFGPHDGTDPFDVGISALAGAGKIVVCSAGNDADGQIHARGQIPSAGSPSTLEFQYTLDSYTKITGTQNDVVLFDGYYESTDNYSVTVIGPTGQTVGPVTRGNTSALDTTDGAIQVENGVATSATGDYEVWIALFDYNNLRAPRAGAWTIRFTRVSSTNSNIDLWNYYTASHMSGRFTSNYTAAVTIGSPGSALSAITVGAYTGKNTWASINGSNYSWSPLPTLGDIAPFSSLGPLRDGTQKPDITGPGFGVVSTLSSDVNTTGLEPYIVPDGVHWIQAGTSMAAPMVSGLCALVLRKEGAITPAQMKVELAAAARTDAYTGSVPNYEWGYGKMSGKAADMTPPTVAVTAPNGGENLTAGVNSNITWTATDNFTITSVDLLYSTDGGATYPNTIATGEANDGSYSWPVPMIATTTARVKVVAHDQGANDGEDASNANFTIVLPDTEDPSVTVTDPDGGEDIPAESFFDVTWSATDNVGVTSIDLYYSTDGGATYPNVIATGEANDGTYTWTVPLIGTTTARVKVVAHDAAANSGEDASNANFTIRLPDTTPPSVAVTAPDGGESFQEGSTTDITWTASDTGMKPGGVTGLAATIAGIDSVTISYSLDNGANWTVLAHGEDNDGTYSWTLPMSPTDSALVRVAAYDTTGNSASDVSDAVFTITSSTGVGEPVMPAALALSPARPNPLVAGAAQISFGLTREGPVSLSVFDASGRRVATLADEAYSAGFHTVSWDGRRSDGSRAPSGIYFYRLVTREGTKTHRLMVMR